MNTLEFMIKPAGEGSRRPEFCREQKETSFDPAVTVQLPLFARGLPQLLTRRIAEY